MKELINELKYNSEINKDCTDITIRNMMLIDRLQDIQDNYKEILEKLIKEKINKIDTQLHEVEKPNVIQTLCIRRLELIYLLDDIKEVLKDA